LIISLYFDVLGKVITKRGMFPAVVPSRGDRRVADVCLTLIRSKPWFTRPSEMSSTGVETGICRITALIGFWDSGIESKVWEVIALEAKEDD
jgi:hypothetical protein